jgi:hypothetical protein
MIEFFDLFYTSGIATVSEIYYVPYYNHSNQLCNRAYITIHNWHDTPAAFNFLHKLNTFYEARILYDNADELWFPVTLAIVAPVTKPTIGGYSIINYLVHTDYTYTNTLRTLDLNKLHILDKPTDLLIDYTTSNTLYTA